MCASSQGTFKPKRNAISMFLCPASVVCVNAVCTGMGAHTRRLERTGRAHTASKDVLLGGFQHVEGKEPSRFPRSSGGSSARVARRSPAHDAWKRRAQRPRTMNNPRHLVDPERIAANRSICGEAAPLQRPCRRNTRQRPPCTFDPDRVACVHKPQGPGTWSLPLFWGTLAPPTVTW